MAETARPQTRTPSDRRPFLFALVAATIFACLGLVLHSAAFAGSAVVLGGAVAAYVPVTALLRARTIAAIERCEEPIALESYLASSREPVREAAGERLATLLPREQSVALLRSRARDARGEAGARALARALATRQDARKDALAALLADLPGADEVTGGRLARTIGALSPEPSLLAGALADSRASVRLALARSIASSDEGARALVTLAGEAALAGDLRGEALDELERSPRAAVRAAAREALSKDATAELLWALALAGEPDDAALAARFVAAPSFPIASSAAHAAEELLARGAPANAGAVREALSRGRESLRAEHAPGENPLADDLVERLSALEELVRDVPS
ncbi:hypothetical protein HY251_14345 [bacterium]|nr:hypothetical protein [bacterium]